jgi:soluble lytic murein transglycosylase-like protein
MAWSLAAKPVAPLVILPDFSGERDSLVAQEAHRAGVPTLLAVAVSHVENPDGDSLAVSRAGAVGLMQVNPRVWRTAFLAECGVGSLLGRRRNACVGVRVLLRYIGRETSIDRALRAYNGSTGFRGAGDRYTAAVLEEIVRLSR